jgi:hypothetical protein
MIGSIFITRSGYDPQLGRHIKDPTLDNPPSLGACRPDIRRRLAPGDHLFVISGKVKDADQFVIGGFEIEEKIDAQEAYRRFPEQRLRRREDGQLTGNIIVDARGHQRELDDHATFARRLPNYLVGRNAISLVTPAEIALAREQTLEVLRDIFQRNGASPWAVVGRFGRQLTEAQIMQLREWLYSVKKSA